MVSHFTRKKDSFAEQAVITAPGAESFREYVLFIQNGIRLLDIKGNLIQTAAGDDGEPVDAEDTGEKGYNYRSERFANRLARDPRVWKVFSSKVHGDPATPVWKAYSGDRVIFRTMMPADKPRNTSLTIHDHIWREQQRDPFSRIIPLQGGVSIGNRFDIELLGGAGCSFSLSVFIGGALPDKSMLIFRTSNTVLPDKKLRKEKDEGDCSSRTKCDIFISENLIKRP